MPVPKDPDKFFDQVRIGIEEGRIPKGVYSSILVDEVHDFKPEWLRLIVEQVSTETESLLLLYDDAQKLYGSKRAKRYSFKAVGVKAQGRTSILRLNYRNTQEILKFAYDFASPVIKDEGLIDEDGPLFVLPESSGSHGPSCTSAV